MRNSIIGVVTVGILAIVIAIVVPSQPDTRWRTGGGLSEQKAADAESLARIAARVHDPDGRLGSGIRATNYQAGAKAQKPSRYEGRLYRTGYAGYEPTLGVTSNGWIFYAAAELESRVLRSKDGGATWESVFTRTTADPYLWVDPATDRIFTVDYVGCGLMSYSDDFGETWTEAPPVGCGYNTDHQTLYAGPAVTSVTTGYPNVIYYCSFGGGALSNTSTITACSKSIDGGLTFLPTLTPPFGPTFSEEARHGLPGICDGGTGHIFVGADGAVYVPRGVCGQPWLAISRDEGASWTRVQVASNGMGRMASGEWDHEAAVRADAQGNVFYSWVARDRIPYLAVSRDRGATWGAPIRVAPPGVNEADLPNMDMDEAGRVALVYMGSTNSPGIPFPNDGHCTPAEDPVLYALYTASTEAQCHPAAAIAAYSQTTWNAYISVTENPLAVQPEFDTAPVNDPTDPMIVGECGPFRCQQVLDFIDVEFGPNGEIVAAVIDACDSDNTCVASGEAVIGKLVLPSAGPVGAFVPDGTLALHFIPEPASASGVPSPEGCESDTSVPLVAGLGPEASSGPCRSAAFAGGGSITGANAAFVSAPFPDGVSFGGAVSIVFYKTAPLAGMRLNYSMIEIRSDGGERRLGGGLVLESVKDGRNVGAFSVEPVQLAKGSRLEILLENQYADSSGARILFGGSKYGDAGITLTTGRFMHSPAKLDLPESGGYLAGGCPPSALMVLLGLLLLRHRSPS